MRASGCSQGSQPGGMGCGALSEHLTANRPRRFTSSASDRAPLAQMTAHCLAVVIALRASRAYVSRTIGVDRWRSVLDEASEAANAASGPQRRARAGATTTARPRARSRELPLVV